MRSKLFWIFGSGGRQSALGCSLMPSRLLFNELVEQPRALRHAPLPNIQKCQQRIFATLYFMRSFFDYLFLQRFTLRSFFDCLFSQRFILRSFFDYLFRL